MPDGLSQVFQVAQNKTVDLVVPFDPEWVAIDNPGAYWVHFPNAIGAFQWIRPSVFNAIVPAPGGSHAIHVTTSDVPPGFPVPGASTALVTITVYERGYFGGGSPLAPNPGVPGAATDSVATDVLDLAGGDASANIGVNPLPPPADHQHPARSEGTASVTARGSGNVRMGVSAGKGIILFEDGANNVWGVGIDGATNKLDFFLGGTLLMSLTAAGLLAAIAGVGNDTVGHTHNQQGDHSQTGPASAGTAHTHSYNDPGGVNNFTFGATSGESVPHTHKG